MEGLGIGIDIQAHDVTLKVTLMVILFQKKFTNLNKCAIMKNEKL